LEKQKLNDDAVANDKTGLNKMSLFLLNQEKMAVKLAQD
jgi:hypothetical protein